MNKNQGQDTRIYGLHDHLFRRRIDLQREDGDTSFSYPAGTGSGARNALTWHPEPANLAWTSGVKRCRATEISLTDSLTHGKVLPYPLPIGVSHRYDHLKMSSVFPFDDVKQKASPVDKRNGIGIATQGDKPYGTPEESASFHTRPLPASAPPALPPSTGRLRRGNPPNLLNLCPSFKWIRSNTGPGLADNQSRDLSNEFSLVVDLFRSVPD
eukprot:sb/3470149/